jgi:hypothetical protein
LSNNNNNNNNGNNAENKNSANDIQVSTDSSEYRTWFYAGRFRRVPPDWELPTTGIKTIWLLWWFGNQDLHIIPYRKLHFNDVVKSSEPKDQKAGVQLSKTKTVMNAIETMMQLKNIVPLSKKMEELTQEESSLAFDLGYTKLMEQLQPNSTKEYGRIGDKSICRLYNLISNKAVFLSGIRKRKYREIVRNRRNMEEKYNSDDIDQSTDDIEMI